MRIKAILYDFDGVIKESTEIKTIAFEKLYAPYGTDVAEKVVQHHISHGGISRFEKFKLYHKNYLGIDLNEEQINELADQFSAIVLDQVIQSNYVKGALESIQRLSEKCDQFIVTGTPQNEIELITNSLNISQYFKGILGSPKDKITLSQEILDQYGYQSNEVLFIGDASTDYKAAIHFSFYFILREHDENEKQFQDISVIKTKDLTNLEQLIQNL
ncbi:MAG: HAD hydrolase-like protein [Crocinitomicaceae bacterium]